MANRRDREKEERRKSILEKAQALFAKKGYIGTSMAEIAESSEFAVGSLYSFFKSKDEILATIFEYHIEHLIARITEIRNDPKLNAKEKIDSSLDALVRIYVDNQEFFRIYVAEAEGIEWGVRTEVGEYIYHETQKFLNVLTEIFKDAIKEGFVDSSLDPEYLALLLRTFIHSTVIHFLFGKREFTVEELLDLTRHVLFCGIRPCEGGLKRSIDEISLFP
jgi:AcrR family transcriptional regulator